MASAELSPERAGEATSPAPVLRLSGISKAYGPTRANQDLSFTVTAGEVVGLIGANGAGKSTLMRILSGITLPDAGRLELGGTEIDLRHFSPERARVLGIRIVHQELSLCPSLTVAENFYIEQPGRGRPPLWRRHYERLAAASIAAIFPESGINVRRPVAALTLAQRQMVEIARAGADPKLRLLILDEPSSALDAHRSRELQGFIANRAASGVAVIFISHKLEEVEAVSGRVLVMRNGRLALDQPTRATTVPQMIAAMVGEAARELERPQSEGVATGKALAEVRAPWSEIPLVLHAGEIIGLAGLEGSGQREFLRALQSAGCFGRHGGGGIACLGSVSYVAGDRAAEGVFPLWDVIANAMIGRIAAGPLLAWARPAAERITAAPFLEAVRLPSDRSASPILELSGGNQQKVLMARALIAEADILLLDDPTRGVDVAVKRDFYALIREAAAAGKLVIWYSSETIEFLECNRVLLFHDGIARRVLEGSALSEDAIVNASFAEQDADASRTRAGSPRPPLPLREGAGGRGPPLGRTDRRAGHPSREGAGKTSPRPSRDALFSAVPFLTTALIFGVIAALNRSAATMFGLDLLLSAAVPLVLVALGQMFVVGGSEIDLGVGAFAGLANVLSATFLVTQPLFGAATLLVALGVYASLGPLIQARAIPAIVVTLGASFIWVGIGYALQPTPGGSAPTWLAATAGFHLVGIPTSLLVVMVAAIVATLVNASRIGVVLRGFGANPRAVAQCGWSPLAASTLRYAIAGTFALLAGLAMTAINTASDINAGGSYTLLSVAAVVVGGSALIGGRIAPVGVVCGALSLSLIGSLLGFLNVSTDYNAAVQGGLLIAILVLRAMESRQE
jgi:ribose transport system ATP-binding protein